MKRLVVLSVLLALLSASVVLGMMGDGGTTSACYPGGFDQVLTGVQPFAIPCATFTYMGSCKYGKIVMFWLPEAAIETTGHANTTVFPDNLFSSGFFGGGSGQSGMVSGEGASDVTSTKYREAHVYLLSRDHISTILRYMPESQKRCMMYAAMKNLVTSGMAFTTESEESWRRAKDGDAMLQVSVAKDVGSWGPLYPLAGWVHHPSNVTVSLLLAYRAQHLGAEKKPFVPSPQIGVDKYEIGGPNPGSCHQIGSTTTTMEKGANRPGCADRFVTIYWRLYVICCPYT